MTINHATDDNRTEHLAQLYTSLDRLSQGVGGPRLSVQCTGGMEWRCQLLSRGE